MTNEIMSNEDAINTLAQYNEWRRDKNKYDINYHEMPPHTGICNAIDMAIQSLKRTGKKFKGDTCGRMCEGAAYRFEAANQKVRADKAEAAIKVMQARIIELKESYKND